MSAASKVHVSAAYRNVDNGQKDVLSMFLYAADTWTLLAAAENK